MVSLRLPCARLGLCRFYKICVDIFNLLKNKIIIISEQKLGAASQGWNNAAYGLLPKVIAQNYPQEMWVASSCV